MLNEQNCNFKHLSCKEISGINVGIYLKNEAFNKVNDHICKKSIVLWKLILNHILSLFCQMFTFKC